eukprot:1322237-Amorphochlora_amoeboformis.AAC.1
MGVEYTTEVRSYPQDGIATFWQEFPNGVNGTTSGDRECDYKAKPWIGCDWKVVMWMCTCRDITHNGIGGVIPK